VILIRPWPHNVHGLIGTLGYAPRRTVLDGTLVALEYMTIRKLPEGKHRHRNPYMLTNDHIYQPEQREKSSSIPFRSGHVAKHPRCGSSAQLSSKCTRMCRSVVL